MFGTTEGSIRFFIDFSRKHDINSLRVCLHTIFGLTHSETKELFNDKWGYRGFWIRCRSSQWNNFLNFSDKTIHTSIIDPLNISNPNAPEIDVKDR